MADQVIVVPTPINPVNIKGAIAFSAEHARIWAEGSDAQVEELGGEHSAKGWAEATGEAEREYTDEQIALAKQELTNEINRQSGIVLAQSESYTDSSVSTEAGIRAETDANLQSQIDAITSASDVFDIVPTYQDLLNYDTSTVPVNDIIKVLSDSTHNDAASYYRWDGEEWDYIGSEGASYTKSEADAKFLTKTDAANTYVNDTELSTALALKQPKTLDTSLTIGGVSQTTVEGALGAINTFVETKKSGVVFRTWED